MFGLDIYSLTLISTRQRQRIQFSAQMRFDEVLLIFLFCALQISVCATRVSAQTARIEPGRILHFDCTRDINKYPDVRQALIIGDSSYDDITWPSLKGLPLNDALDMAQHLCNVGFSIDVGADLDASGFRSALKAFSSNMPKKGVRLFYYSGHGLEAEDINYLIPVGLPQSDIVTKAPTLDDVFSALDNDRLGGNVDLTKIVILDACRDMKSKIGTGFTRPNTAPSGSIIAYATAPASSSSASGDNNRNSLYTEYLLNQIGIPGLGLEDLFGLVRNDVYKASSHFQIPWESSSTLSTFRFEPPLTIDKTELQAPDPDDLVVVSINGSPVIENWREGVPAAWIEVTDRLRPGTNSLTVQVYNDKTMSGNQPVWWPGAKREGWHYTLNSKVSGAASGSWSDRQDDGVDDAHWGALFTTLSGSILVDGHTGKVTIRNVSKQPH
jgi:hypothetical protein